MNNNSKLAIALLLCLSATQANAQDDKKEKVPVYNVVIDDPMDAFGRQPEVETVFSPVAFPDFFSFKTRKSKDTVFRYECYDSDNELVAADTVSDIDDIRYISLIKSYNDPVETYTDTRGVKQPLPMAKIIYRYDRIGSGKWMSVDYSNNKSIYLAEFQTYTSRTDTTLIQNPVTGVSRNVIHKYYKVLPAKL